MRIFRKLALSLPLLLVSLTAGAVVAKPGPVSVRQPDGTVRQVYLHGDEFFHYMTDAAGNVLRRNEAGYIRPASVTAHDLETAAGKREKTFSHLRPLLSDAGAASTKAGDVYYHKGLVILVNFSDNSFSVQNPHDAFSRMLNEEGYSDRGGTGSARDYYMDNSCGQFVPSFDVCGPYTLPHDMEYYGGNDDAGNDKNPWQMAVDAVDAAYADGVNLSDYDSDKDGVLDYVFIYYAGYGEEYGADSKTVWPHASSMYYQDVEKGGVRYGSYACGQELIGTSGTEMDNIGTFCHEFGHVLGLTDLYDTDYEESGGQSMALGDLSIMSNGSYNNSSRTPPCLIAEERATLGWLQLKALTAGELTMNPISENEAYCLKTDNDGEYYLFEVRKRDGWDRYISGAGLLVYHVDKSDGIVYGGRTAANLWLTNAPNVYPVHECMKLVPADNSSVAGAFYPGTSNQYTSFNAYTQPAARAWSMMPLSLELSDIRQESDGRVTFTASETQATRELMGKVTDFYGSPIEGACLTLIPQTGGSSQTAYTGEGGAYLFPEPVAAGGYVLCCVASGYESSEQTIRMEDSPVIVSFSLMKEGESAWTFSWANGDIGDALGADEPFSAAVLWEPGDISLQKKVSVKNAGIYVYMGKTDITARVYVDGKRMGEKTLSSFSVVEGGYNVIDLSDLGIIYQNTQSLQIVFLFSKVTDGCYLGTDLGPAKAGKGDLFGNAAGGDLTSLYEHDGFDLNWLAYVTLEGDPVLSLENGLVCLSGQRSMYLEWEEIGDSWTCSYVGEGQMGSLENLTQPHVLLEDLKPGSTYQITIEGFSEEGNKVAAYTFTHDMTFTQSRPMYISYLNQTFKSKGRMLLEVYNVPDNAKVTWFVDGEQYNEPLLECKSATQVVEAHVYISATEGTEIIRRKVASSAQSKSSLVNGRSGGASLPEIVRKKL